MTGKLGPRESCQKLLSAVFYDARVRSEEELRTLGYVE
jgi:hypothetical protein